MNLKLKQNSVKKSSAASMASLKNGSKASLSYKASL
jgi:hypothetical protein